jgi:signal transduction histidine kinase
MRPVNLWGRTSFRLAMSLTLLIVAALLLAGGIGFGLMHAQLSIRQEARVTEMYRALEPGMVAGDQRDLVEGITARIAASPDRSSVYALRDRAGAVLASNIIGLDQPLLGWSTIPADLPGITTNYPYRVFTGTAGEYTLSVGLTDADLDDLREIMAAALGWSALVVLLAALGVAALLATRMDRRLTGVDQMMNRVAEGDLTARLPLTGRGGTAINGALARLENLVEAVAHVSTDIAHDLRTPLSHLRLSIETAASKALSGRPVADDLAEALQQTDDIDATFAALLRIAQIESGSRRARFRALDPARILSDVAEVYAPVAVDAGMSLTIGPLSQVAPVLIMGDAELLTQMIANLIENAIRHCPPGTVIACSLDGSAGAVCLSVADTGPGIAVAEREKVLRRLYRLEKSRTSEGSGLGLSLVKAIADLHQATLTLSDTQDPSIQDTGQGTGLTVSIRFLPTGPLP